jgi:hypothetical protein
MALFAYSERLSEVLKRGEVYFPGESVKKFGLQIANIEPVMVADGVSFEWGELVVLDNDGRAAKVSGTTAAADIYGVVHRNATATYTVLSEQVFQMAPRLTLSVFRGGRDGEIAVPLQSVSDNEVTPSLVAPAKGGQVYVRIAASTANTALPIGGIETQLIQDETIAWTGVTFTGPDYSPARTEDEHYTTVADGATNKVVGILLP